MLRVRTVPTLGGPRTRLLVSQRAHLPGQFPGTMGQDDDSSDDVTDAGFYGTDTTGNDDVSDATDVPQGTASVSTATINTSSIPVSGVASILSSITPSGVSTSGILTALTNALGFTHTATTAVTTAKTATSKWAMPLLLAGGAVVAFMAFGKKK